MKGNQRGSFNKYALIVLLIGLIQTSNGRDCRETDLSHSFSACRNDERTAFFYLDEECTVPSTFAVDPPIKALSCSISCPEPGTFLDIDYNTKQPTCSHCPRNTFSLGTSRRISTIDDTWENILKNKALATCFGGREKECTSWTPTEDGKYLRSGELTEKGSGSYFESFLKLYYEFLEDGQLEIRYKATKGGYFLVYLDAESIWHNQHHSSTEWRTQKIDIPEGKHHIFVTFVKKISDEDSFALLKEISVTPVSQNSLYCTPCPEGTVSEPGSSHCQKCLENYYFDGSNCTKCPHGTVSDGNGTDQDSCITSTRCTNDDFSVKYSECHEDGTQTIDYVWIEPRVCDDTGFQEPAAETLEKCVECNPGLHRVDGRGICSPCELGYARIDNNCTQCSAGKFAEQGLFFDHFYEIPPHFSSSCYLSEGVEGNRVEQCKTHSWNVKDDKLTVGNIHAINIDIALELAIEIDSAEEGKIVFDYQPSNFDTSTFVFKIDDSEVYNPKQPQSETLQFTLSTGTRKLAWIFRLGSEFDEDAHLSIPNIFITGISPDEEYASATDCTECPEGHVSTAGSHICTACKAGEQVNAAHSACDSCPDGQFSPHSGSECRECPHPLNVNDTKTGCFFSSALIYPDNHMVNLQRLTDWNAKGSICKSGTNQDYCNEGYYKVIVNKADGVNSLHYLTSFLNYGVPALEEKRNLGRIYRKKDSKPNGYIFGINDLRKERDIQRDKLEAINGDVDVICLSYQESLVTNYGSSIESFQMLDSGSEHRYGFTIQYADGDLCSYDSSYSSEVSFECDKTEGDGYPTFVSMDRCKLKFIWKSRQICPYCRQEDFEIVESTCVNGVRTISRKAPDYCRFDESLTSTQEECSEAKESFSVVPVMIVIGVLLILIGTCCCIAFCYFRKTREFQGLLNAQNKPAREL